MSSLDRVAGVDDKNRSDPSTLYIMDGEFDKLVEKLLEAHHVPGMSIAIVHNGKVQCKVRSSYKYGYLICYLPQMPRDTASRSYPQRQRLRIHCILQEARQKL